MKNQEELIDLINETGESAYSILYDADKRLISRFNRIDKQMTKLLEDVRRHFPDAEYYTASGGFNLMIGKSHSEREIPQSDLIAVSGITSISDGDF